MTSFRITPTTQEKVMREGDLIVSKTDIKGRITYGNRTFNEYSGFKETELIGTQHNIIPVSYTHLTLPTNREV